MEDIYKTLERTTTEEFETMDNYMKKMSDMMNGTLVERKEETRKSEEEYRQNQKKEYEVIRMQQEIRLKEAKIKSLEYDKRIQEIYQETLVTSATPSKSSEAPRVLGDISGVNVVLTVSESIYPPPVIHVSPDESDTTNQDSTVTL
jgi:hypothetical protein